jgi:hypothetical protein
MIDIPRIEKGQVPRHGFHSFERMSLEHLRMVTIPWKFFAPCKVVIWGLPLSVVDKRVTPRDLIKKDVPRDLSDNVANFPTSSFLDKTAMVNKAIE